MDLTGFTGTTSRFQHYQLLRRDDGTPWELGRGTMGVTYKAFDVNLRCEVALKVVNPALLNHPNARERFVREARAAARLRHRNIASVYHLGTDGDHFFYAMEFIDGETLDALVRRHGPLSPDAALRVLLQAARALGAAARQGLIHRDIKPGNIMVVHEDDDDHRVVKLIDFGLARSFAGEEDGGHLTASGFVGTPMYTSPEQLNERPVDERSDIYSLGITAWFLLCGRAPFTGPMSSIFQQHLHKPLPWEQMPAGVPRPVRDLLGHMLEKNPDRRPQTAVELRREIEACRDHVRDMGGANPEAVRLGSATSENEVRLVDAPQPPGASAPISAPVGPPGELGPGMILKGRYELLQLAGEGNSGRVFQARDRAEDGGLRALKLLRSDLTGETTDREILADEVRLIQSVPHANLINLTAFERLSFREMDFLVQEWLQGFTVVDLLAARNGALTLLETLRILRPAAAAVDHAAANNLERLDLAPHQMHVHFPDLPVPPTESEATLRRLLQNPLETWPAWTLKINPLGAIHRGLESSTWMGDITILPGATPALNRDTHLDDRKDPLAVSYSRGLARAVYEALGGSPAQGGETNKRRGRYVSLPTLNEAGNAVLQSALFDEPGYESSRAFFDSLVEETGIGPEDLTVARSGDESRRSSAVVVPPVATPPLKAGPMPGPNVIRDDSPSRKGNVPVLAIAGDDSSKQIPNPDPASAVRTDLQTNGSLWDRVDRAAETSRRYRSWLPTAGVASLLLAALLIIVTVAFFHSRSRGSKPRPTTAETKPGARKPLPTHAASPPPIIPANTPAIPEKPRETPGPVAETSLPSRDASTPPPHLAADATPANTPPTPAPTPRDKQVKVRLDSRPSGAEIYLGNKFLGSTPIEIVLPPGEHPLVARYRNWPEVRHVLHLDTDQLTATEDIRMISPTLVPTSEATASPARSSHRATPDTAKRDATRPSPGPGTAATPRAPNASPRPATSSSPSSRRDEPFLPRRSTPAPSASDQPPKVRRALPILTPFDPDGSLQQQGRHKNLEPQRQPDVPDDGG